MAGIDPIRPLPDDERIQMLSAGLRKACAV
jgi:hypothetical protein